MKREKFIDTKIPGQLNGSAKLAKNIMRLLENKRGVALRASLCVLGVLLFAVGSAAQHDHQAGQESSPALRQAISDAARKYKIPGIAAALIEHGQLRAVEVFGVRDQKSNIPISGNTIFEAGSLGEPLYAYAVLLLSANGRCNLGAPLPSYLPLPYLRDLDATSASSNTESLYDPAFNQVTAFRVMNHTSGMPEWARSQHLRLQFAPGQKWSYSNEGYLYLQRVVERITGEPFNDFIARSVLGPVGMPRSGFTWRDSYTGEIATGYDRSGAPVEAQRYSRPAATATLYTTVQEYSRFVQRLLASAPAQRAHESAVSLMLNPNVDVEKANAFSWGLGLGVEKTGDDLFFFQRDNNSGFQSFVMASRKTGKGIIFFTNSGNGLDAAPDIIAATLAGNHPVLKSAFVRGR